MNETIINITKIRGENDLSIWLNVKKYMAQIDKILTNFDDQNKIIFVSNVLADLCDKFELTFKPMHPHVKMNHLISINDITQQVEHNVRGNND